jgi:hypothetical protein
MPSPFPGMDPYLENPEIFPDFHDSFVTCYDAGPYAREIDYSESQIIPPLDANQAAWVTEILRNSRD